MSRQDQSKIYRVVEYGSDDYSRTRALCETEEQAEEVREDLRDPYGSLRMGGGFVEIEVDGDG